MMHQTLKLTFIATMVITVAGCSVDTVDGTLVKNQAEYLRAVKDLQAGDTIVLANGTWSDFEIDFVGTGTKDEPITLKAETKGQVVISGQSNLEIAGDYLQVSGLVFKNGYTPTGAVISFRRNADELANNSRVTEVVIDNFNNPERTVTDSWVMMYGKNNRFDHNHLEGKRNKGVTMAVRLIDEASQDNYHQIDHNYFGPRSILGSNGGETLRIGTSAYSLSESNTLVENNYFDRCDGELEIISNKSGSNIFRGNVFYESRGTLTMRHGNGNLVENNVFFGNGADHTGGIRVINADQTIQNNYMEGLSGYRFGGALVVMNGVPNSSINRYHQVKNAQIHHNSLVESDHVQLAAGSDLERSAKPVDSKFNNNLVYHSKGKEVFTVYDDVSGITFENNIQDKLSSTGEALGLSEASLSLVRAENGLLYPSNPEYSDFGVSKDIAPIQKSETGTNWYSKPEAASIFEGGVSTQVASTPGALAEAIKNATAGDQLQLAAGTHVVSRTLAINKPLTLQAATPEQAATIVFQRTSLFEIQNGGSLQLKNLSISGEATPDNAGNSVVRTQRSSMLINYQLLLDNVSVSDLDVNHSFNFLNAAKSTFADNIEIKNSRFNNITGAILKLDAENDDYGIYSAEYVTITDSVFTEVKGALVTYYRGGTDESTFGPHFTLRDTQLNNVGNGKRNKSGAAIQLHGVQVSNIEQTTIANSPAIKVFHTVGEPVTRIAENTFVSTPAPTVLELNSAEIDTADISGNTYQ